MGFTTRRSNHRCVFLKRYSALLHPAREKPHFRLNTFVYFCQMGQLGVYSQLNSFDNIFPGFSYVWNPPISLKIFHNFELDKLLTFSKKSGVVQSIKIVWRGPLQHDGVECVDASVILLRSSFERKVPLLLSLNEQSLLPPFVMVNVSNQQEPQTIPSSSCTVP